MYRVLFRDGQDCGDGHRGGQYVEDSLFHKVTIDLSQSSQGHGESQKQVNAIVEKAFKT
jgi:hypothetical protein